MGLVHYKYLNSFSAEIDFGRQNQILTSKDGPRAERVESQLLYILTPSDQNVISTTQLSGGYDVLIATRGVYIKLKH